MRKSKIFAGFSLVEILVVILVFSLLGVITTGSLVLSLRGSKKSQSTDIVRENVDYSITTMERLLRSAKRITCTSASQVDYIDAEGISGRFSCLNGSSGYIASGSANLRLTSSQVYIDCSVAMFSCPTPTPPAPPSVAIFVKARDANVSGAEAASITTSTKILLRSY